MFKDIQYLTIFFLFRKRSKEVEFLFEKYYLPLRQSFLQTISIPRAIYNIKSHVCAISYSRTAIDLCYL